MHTSLSNIDYKSNYIGDYIIKETIGTGTFSKVKLGINKYTKEKVAIKLLEKSKITEKEDLKRINREISIIKKLSHPNIIKINEIFENEEYYYIIMDYCSKGELFDYIVKKTKLTEDESSFFFYQIINAIEYIHKKNIVHRDLKPENLLLTENNKIKIIDFNLSNYFYKNNLLSTPCGSPCYAAPEMVSGKKYNGFKTDIWAIGIILYAMSCGYLPFEDSDNEILFQKILECDLEFPNFLSFECIDIIKKILNVNPYDRFYINDIKEHSFYLKGKNIYESYFGKDDFLLEDFEEKKKKKISRKISAENLIYIRNKSKSDVCELSDLNYGISNKFIIKKIEKINSKNEIMNKDFVNSNYVIKDIIHNINFNNNVNEKKNYKKSLKLSNLFVENNNIKNNKDLIKKYYSNLEKENKQINEKKSIKNMKIIEKEKLNHFKFSLLNKNNLYLQSENKYKNRINSHSPITINNEPLQSQNSNIHNVNIIYRNTKFPLKSLPLITQEKTFRKSNKRNLKTDSDLSEYLNNYQINSNRLKENQKKFKIPFNIHNIVSNKHKNISLNGNL